jgi:heme-degrading monooxygenase HmoA
MFARVSRYSGDADRLAAGFESVSGRLEQLEGFTQAFFLTDRDNARAMSITLWESEAALQASAEAAQGLRADASGPADASIEAVESYDVPLTVKAAARTG